MAEPDATATPSVVVVGSINMDLVVQVPRLPAPGETVTGGDLFRNPGGKGANQAVAASRLGQRVAMVGCVGDDDSGTALAAALEDAGVDTSNVRVVPGVPTGTALIAVSPDGENQIVVSPGANARVSPGDVTAAAGMLGAAMVTLLQLEIPIDTVVAAASAAGGTVILNPAPAREVPEDLLALADVLVPNRMELSQLARVELPRKVEEAVEAARRLSGPRAVVVTLGPDGAVVVTPDGSTHVPGIRVEAVDATAAGDSFCGALADALARGEGLEDAVRWAVRAAALTCTHVGAQAALPGRDEVLGLAEPGSQGPGSAERRGSPGPYAS
jgi:ribokinase